MNKTYHLWETLKRLLTYAIPHRKQLTAAIFMLVIAAVAETACPLIVGYFIDNYVAKGMMPLAIVIGLIATYALLALVAVLMLYWQKIFFNRAAVGVIQTLRCDVMEAALLQPLKTFDKQPVGQIISRVTNDTEAIRDLYVTVISTVANGGIFVGVMLVAMFILNWHMALIVVFLFPMIVVVMWFYQRYSTPVMRQVRSYLAEINNSFNEAINGMAIIQQFRQQQRFSERMYQISWLHYCARFQAMRLESFLLRPLLNLFVALVLCGLLLLFGFEGEELIGVGVLYAFISYLDRLSEPLIELTSQQSILQQALVAGERIFELIDCPKQRYGDDNRPLKKGDIDIDSVSFAFQHERWVLKQISLQVPACSFVALVGHTGSGKSTLANLLMGYYPVNKGEIRIDGRALSSLSHAVLRQGVAMVQQDPVVLADSVLANVCLGRDISEVAVWKILEIVQLDAFVRSLPKGIHTHLGEQGNNLSVGQKQLLALARVLVFAPKIIILDEATANIDSGTEQAIQHALRLIREKSTLFVIAHRLSTIVEADTIFVLNHGQIVEQGTHQQLLMQQGRYYQMYQLQLVENKLSTTSVMMNSED